MAGKTYERQDRFYKKAKKEGYVARSAYKIVDFARQYKIFVPGQTVIDLGCSPGSWLQIAQEKMKNQGLWIGLDLEDLSVPLAPGNAFFKGDFLSEAAQTWLEQQAPKGADWVLSDMSPHLTGIRFKDQAQMFELIEKAFALCQKILRPHGNFLFKFFPSPEFDALKKDLQKSFARVEIEKSAATRGSSNEFYMVCLDKKP